MCDFFGAYGKKICDKTSYVIEELKRNEERKAVGYLTKENINDIIKVQSEEEEDAGQSD